MAHEHRLRVRYAETDAQGVAHHATYVVWLEEARIEYLRARGRSYRELEASGLLLPVLAVDIRYRRALRFDDEVVIATCVSRVGPSRLRFASEIRCGDRIHAEASVTVGAVDAQLRPQRLPADLVTLVDADSPA